jgi:peptidoglycan/LPS O-acetylase OafA/YrhL
MVDNLPAAAVGPRSSRISHLESLRGIAACQVLLLHIFSAFFPNLALYAERPDFASAIHGSPLFFFYDGYSAVYIFFILSGVVLTYAFGRSIDRPFPTVLARIFRLLVPAVFACALAFAMKALTGSPNIEAGHISGSPWLSGTWSPPHGIVFFLRDAFVNSVWLGYQGYSIFDMLGFESLLNSPALAYDAPLWTLSIELQGSLLVLFAVFAARKSTLAGHIFVTIAAVMLFRTPYVCFIAGHYLAKQESNDQSPTIPWGVSIIAVIAGIALCVSEEQGPLPPFAAACNLKTFVSLPCTLHFQKIIGAMLLFWGLVRSEPVTAALSWPPLVGLGRISFSLYLVHWPILCGAASFVLVAVQAQIGNIQGRLLASFVALVLSFLMALAFSPIDRMAVSGSRRLRAFFRNDDKIAAQSS